VRLETIQIAQLLTSGIAYCRQRLLWRCAERFEFGNRALVFVERLGTATGGKPKQTRGLALVVALQCEFAGVEIRLADLVFLGAEVRIVCSRKHGLRRQLPEVEADDRRRPFRHFDLFGRLG
jgi:hypothetical protein